MGAKLFFAVRALKAGVGFFRKTFGVKSKGNLPPDKQRQRAEKQHKREEKRKRICRVYQEYKRREHHRVIPIVNAAARTAFIFHKQALERAVEKYANHIAHRVEKANQKQNALVNNPHKEKRAYHGVKGKPYSGDGKRNPPRKILRFCTVSGFLKIARKLLLTSHTLKL